MSEVIAFIGRANVHVPLIWLCRYYAAGGINTHFEKNRKYRNATQVKATVDGEVTTMSLHRLMSLKPTSKSCSLKDAEAHLDWICRNIGEIHAKISAICVVRCCVVVGCVAVDWLFCRP